MAIELAKDQAATAALHPEGLPARPSSATLSFKSPGGSVKLAPSVTLATVGSASAEAVTAATSQVVFTVADATGFVPGGKVWMTCSDGWAGPVTIDEVSGTTITLLSAPPGTITTASVCYPLKLSATLTAASTASLDRNYQLEWTITDADGGVHTRRTIAHVVRMVFADPVSDERAKEYTAANFRGWAASQTAGWFRTLAARANARIKGLIRVSGDFPYMVGDSTAFQHCAEPALALELAELSLLPSDVDVLTYIDAREASLRRRINEALANTWIDRDDDGDAEDPGEVSQVHTIRVTRR